ncbi:hypothetical protein ACFW6E_31490 [Streptomyces olivaceoviridis]|uniref:hypothetical protein n=1 Tax=Streptomyces olivaceoviridis TaxID=1921 RepID=UPI003676F3BA
MLCYEVYTIVGDQALLVYEQALRDRFMEWCSGIVTFRVPQTADVSYTVTSYDDVKKRADRMMRQRAKLIVGTHTIEFDGMLHGLRLWARTAGLLRGRSSRAVEDALAKLRNHVAHPSDHHLDSPVGVARTVRDLTELINQLWGQATPDGRLYPAPLHREVAVLSWNSSGRTRMEPAGALTTADSMEGQEGDEYQHVVVRAIPFIPGSRWNDAHWAEFDTRYETTRFPTEFLWGPGTRAEARKWLEHEQPEGDSIDFTDRVFLIQDNGRLLPPMRPAVAAGLSDSERVGIWHAVRADFPTTPSYTSEAPKITAPVTPAAPVTAPPALRRSLAPAPTTKPFALLPPCSDRSRRYDPHPSGYPHRSSGPTSRERYGLE